MKVFKPISPYVTLIDAELIQLMKNNDYDAFAEVYSRYATAMYVLVRNKVTDINDSEDICAKVFTELWGSRESLNLNQDLVELLYKKCTREILSYIANHHNRGEIITAHLEIINAKVNLKIPVENESAASKMEHELKDLPLSMLEGYRRNENLIRDRLSARSSGKFIGGSKTWFRSLLRCVKLKSFRRK